MSVLSWVRVAVCLWLLRKAVKVAKWLLIAAVAVAAWPVTVVTGAGYAAAWLRGWQSSWGQLTGLGVARTFLLLVPAGTVRGGGGSC